MTRRIALGLVLSLLCQSLLAMAAPMTCAELASPPPCHESVAASGDADTAMDCEIRCAQAGAAAMPGERVVGLSPGTERHERTTIRVYHAPDPRGIFHPPIDL